jgi:hypothetical protein
MHFGRSPLAIGLLIAVAGCSASEPPPSRCPTCTTGKADAADPVRTHFLVPLVDENYGTERLSTYNDRIVAAGFEALPDAVEVPDYDTWADLLARIEEMADVVDMPLAYAYAQSPDEYEGLCYRGDAHEVANLAAQLQDSVFGDMFLVLGYRYRDHEELFFEPWEDPTPGERIDAWNEFSGEGEDVLILHTVGDSGYEAAGTVPRCEDDAPPPPVEARGLTDFTCHTVRPEEGETATIRFTLERLGEESVGFLWPEDEEASPIDVTPETSAAYTLVWGVADGYVTHREDRLRIFTDQAGIEFGELELYANSDFTRGYFLFESSLGDPGFYSEVYCDLEAR